ncbi:MAG: tetratricopeptide repeat protein [Chlorobi bacterium]|nr:tetratricopeptide repeat protein [Chlorobiota bacterium]
MLLKISKLIILTLILSIGNAYAQKGVEDGSKYGHGEDSIRCLKNLSLYAEYFKQKNIKDALPYWQQAFDECPKSTSNIYKHGEAMYKMLLSKEKDPTKREEYYNKLMQIYDQRIKYFGNSRKYPTPYIQGKKAVAMLKYKGYDPEVVKEAFDLMNKAIEAQGPKTQNSVLVTFMTTTVNRYKEGDLSADAVMQNYSTVSNILNKKIASSTGKKKDENVEIKNMIDKLFATSGVATCDNIEKIFGPMLPEHQGDENWLRRINHLLAKSDCGDSQLFFKTSELLYKIEPSSSSAYGLFKMNLKTQNLDKAKEYIEEAIKLEENPADKAKFYTKLALLYLSEKKYPEVKATALKALKLDPKNGDAYILIGKAYAAYAKNYGDTEFEHSTVYWAAVDKFIKAKQVDPEVAEEANNLISIYSAHFPNKEDIFFQKDVNLGGTYHIGGWINETTKVREKK